MAFNQLDAQPSPRRLSSDALRDDDGELETQWVLRVQPCSGRTAEYSKNEPEFSV